MPRVRTTIAGFAAVTVLAASAAPAAAQETVTVSAAEAGAAGVTLTVAGTEALTIAETATAAVPGAAAALGNPLQVGGSPIGGASVESEGDAVAEDGCASPEIPAPLSSLLDLGVACVDLAADGDARSASATAGVAEVAVLELDGGDLGPLADLLDTLPLDELLDTLEDQLLGQLGAADGLFGDLREQCADGLETLLGPIASGLLQPLIDQIAAADPTEVVGGLLTEVIGLVDELLPTACAVLGDLAELITGDDGLVGSISDGDLLGALDDTEGLLTLSLLETTSAVDRDGDAITAAAGPGDDGTITLTLDVPLLGDVLRDLLVGALTPLAGALDSILDPLDDAVSGLPVLGEIVAPLLTSGDLAAIAEGPLLEVGIAPGSASASGDLGDLTTDGDAQPALVNLDGSLLSLPVLSGLDDALDALAGQLDSQLLSVLRDSPLGDLVAVSLLPGDVDEDATVQGLPGTEATSGTASVTVLGILGDPLLAVDVAPAVAGVGVDEATADAPESPEEPEEPVTTAGPDPQPLPVTGTTGAALFGLLALGSAALLRRRDA